MKGESIVLPRTMKRTRGAPYDKLMVFYAPLPAYNDGRARETHAPTQE